MKTNQKSDHFLPEWIIAMLSAGKNFSAGETTETWREIFWELNLAGKQIFLAGHHATSAGMRFSGVVTGGVQITWSCNKNAAWK